MQVTFRGAVAGSAILPGMSGKFLRPRITMVGAGNLAGALATSLHHAGYVIERIVARGGGVSLRRAQQLAQEVGASAGKLGKIGLGRERSIRERSVSIDAEIIWFCVPDGAIAGAARSLATVVDWKPADWKSKVALHSSGALTSDELDVLRQRGAAVASVHPLMTFVRGSRPALAGVSFAIEGDRRAVRAARSMVKNLGGEPYSIRADDKAAYHTWGTFASPLLTALLATSERVAAGAGVKSKAVKQRMLPMLKQTLANYEAFGAAQGFSGPIVRGDIDTVKRHLDVLGELPVARAVYLSLARGALAYLPGRNKRTLEKILKSPRRGSGK